MKLKQMLLSSLIVINSCIPVNATTITVGTDSKESVTYKDYTIDIGEKKQSSVNYKDYTLSGGEKTSSSEILMTITEDDYSVTIPKTITLGSDKQANYTVGVDGYIYDYQSISVTPIDTITDTAKTDFYMQNGTDKVVANVLQTKTDWNSDDADNGVFVEDNKIVAPDLLTGEWEGEFNFDIKLNKLTTSNSKVEIGIGQSKQVYAYVNNIDITDVAQWSSNNDNITVTNGLVQVSGNATSGETAKITVTSKDGTMKQNINITVKQTDITINLLNNNTIVNSVDLKQGNSTTIQASFVPSNITGTVTWSLNENAPSNLTLSKNGNSVTLNASSELIVGTYILTASYQGYSNSIPINITSSNTNTEIVSHYKPTDEGYEILNAYDIAFQKAGMKYFPDTDLYINYPDAGPSGGMGWGEAILYPGESLEEQVQSSVKAAQMDCVKYYYLEYIGELPNGGISIIVFTSQ